MVSPSPEAVQEILTRQAESGPYFAFLPQKSGEWEEGFLAAVDLTEGAILTRIPDDVISKDVMLEILAALGRAAGRSQLVENASRQRHRQGA